MEHTARGRRSLSSGGNGAGALRAPVRRCGGELLISSPAPCLDMGQVGASVPETFRFAVKIPKTITHQAKLVEVDALIAEFAEDVEPLGAKLALLLVQLPPKLAFDAAVAERLFPDPRGKNRHRHRVRTPPCDVVRPGGGSRAQAIAGGTRGGGPGAWPRCCRARRMAWPAILASSWIARDVSLFLQ